MILDQSQEETGDSQCCSQTWYSRHSAVWCRRDFVPWWGGVEAWDAQASAGREELGVIVYLSNVFVNNAD